MADEPIKLNNPKIVPFGDGDFTGTSGGIDGITPPGSVRGFNPSKTFFWQVPEITFAVAERLPLMPVSNKRLVYINGINTLRLDHAYTLKLISVVTGARVIGIYNQSGDGDTNTNMIGDLLQSLGDKTGIGKNLTTNTLAKAVFDACTNGVNINIVAHSQGAIITSRAIRRAIDRLKDYYGRQDNETRVIIERIERDRGFFGNVFADNFLDRPRLREMMRERIMPTVERVLDSYVTAQTFGGAASFFPNGPRYRHVYNAWDPVARLFGQGSLIHGRGRGAEVERLNRNSASPLPDFSPDHSVNAIYMLPSQYYVDRNGNRVDNNYIPVDMDMVR